MNSRMQYVPRIAICLAILGTFAWIYAGDLLPPQGPIAPTMKTLVEVEPRRPVRSLSGDDDALHVISVSGSYYLTADIIGQAGKSGIRIDADNVTLDLAGFALMGVEESQHGIRTSAEQTNVAIRSGTVRNWGGDGILLFSRGLPTVNSLNSRISGIMAHENGRDGIRGALGSTIQDCVARNNGRNGIQVVTSTLESCTVTENGQHGILSAESTIRDCLAFQNAGAGIAAGTSVVIHCVAAFNGQAGIDASNRTTVLECRTRQNGSGISATVNCYILNNNCIQNRVQDGSSGAGIRALGGRNRIEGNNVSGNVTGIEITGGTNIIVRNSSTANESANFAIADGNTFGPIVLAAGTGDLSAVANSDHPWANFEY